MSVVNEIGATTTDRVIAVFDGWFSAGSTEQPITMDSETINRTIMEQTTAATTTKAGNWSELGGEQFNPDIDRALTTLISIDGLRRTYKASVALTRPGQNFDQLALEAMSVLGTEQYERYLRLGSQLG